jgi:transcription elongation factor SPT6
MSRRDNDFIDNRADVGSDDEEDEEIDEETGEPIQKSPTTKKTKKKASGPEIDDSSEEEDDDDEEAMRAVRNLVIQFRDSSNTDFCRLGKVLLSTKMKTKTRTRRKAEGDIDERNGNEPTVRKRRKILMRKIWT